MERFTATERAVAALVAGGAPNKEIARTLHVSEQRVKNTLTNCFRRLDLDPARNPRVLLALAVIEQGREREGC